MKHEEVEIVERGKQVELIIDGKSQMMDRSKGWGYLLELLRHPGERRSAASLVAAEQVVPEEYQSLSRMSDTNRMRLDLYEYRELPNMKMADERCIREVKARLQRLIELEAILRVDNNLAALEELLEEKNILQEYLAEVLAVNGRIRSFRGGGEREAASVYKAICRCLDSIAELDPALAKYLKSRLRIWNNLVYEPGELEICC